MSQSRRGSLVEALTNIAVGIVVSFVANSVVLPAVGVPITLTQNLWITAAFTAISLVRSYLLRRLFNILTMRSA